MADARRRSDKVNAVKNSLERARNEDAVSDMAAWYARLTSDEAAEGDRRAFAAWVAADPAHGAAYRRLMSVLGKADAALADADVSADVFEQPPSAADPHSASLFRRAVAALAAGLVVAIGAGSLLLWQRPEFTTAATAVGETRRLELPDGSVVHMNTDTHLAWAMDANTRRVHFEGGEAYFEVARDPSRAFVVAVGSREVRVLGTAFNIRHIAAHTDLAVSEGTVGLSKQVGLLGSLIAPGTAGQPLTAGTRVAYDAGSSEVVRGTVSAAAIASWRRGQLIYRGERLADVIADLDRYFPGSLAVSDPTVANLKVSAVINLDGEDKILSALARQLPIRVSRLPGSRTEISANSP